MARINLTLPDPLYERLERFRDRVNVSKVCALALTKELDMIEGATAVNNEDPKVQRLVNRLLRQQELVERWYRRGKQDGETWAMDRATVDELRMVADDWDDDDAINERESLDDLDDEFEGEEYPTLKLKPSYRRWADEDRKEGTSDEPDWRAYARGWFHGARDLWKAAAPILS